MCRDVCRFNGATVERTIADRSYAVGDCYACKGRAISKCIVADRSNAVGDSYTFKRSATTERIFTNSRNAVANSNACKGLRVEAA